jgi:hypothetical protein
MWLQLLADLQMCYWSQSLTILQRMTLASKCLNSLRLWRLWVKACPSATLKTNFWTRETFQDAAIELNQCINAQFAFQEYSSSVPHEKSLGGSDPCGRIFSNIAGGHGVTNFHCKDATMLDVERNIEKINSLLAIESRGLIKLTTKARRKAEFLYELHEDAKAPPANLRDHPTTAEFTAALEHGLALAQQMFAAVPLVKQATVDAFDENTWNKPWLCDMKWTKEMGALKELQEETAAAIVAVAAEEVPHMDPVREAMTLAEIEQQIVAVRPPNFDCGLELNEITSPEVQEAPCEDDSALLELAAELEVALVLAEEEATAAGKETPCATMVTPKGRFSKNSIVSRRNKCLGAGIKLDPGRVDRRLRKIALNGALTAQKREDESVLVSMEAVEQDCGGGVPR